jgi:hypothetical protein
MRLLTAVSLPTFAFKQKQYKQCFQVGDFIHYRRARRQDWYKQEIVGVARYKLFGRVYLILYRVNYTTRTYYTHTQKTLLQMQAKYDLEHGVREAQVVENKPKRHWRIYEKEGRW